MVLGDFSSLIELSAALNVAFVTIEYAKSFTRGAVKRFFKFHDLIEQRADLCFKKLYDDLTIEKIHPIRFEGGKTTEGQLHESRRKYNELKKDIEDSQKELHDEVDRVCYSKCLPTLCLFLFLYNVTQLFISAFAPETLFLGHDRFSFFSCSFFFLTIFTLLFLCFGWFVAEFKERCVKQFSSLRFVGVVFFICITSSFALGYLNLYDGFTTFIASIWDFIVVISVLLIFINFLVVLFLLHRKGENAKKQIENRYKKLNDDCEERNKDIEKHMHGEELNMKSEVYLTR
jgi:hypothetical protein